MKKQIKFVAEMLMYLFAGTATGLIAMWAVTELILTKIQ